MEIRTIARAGGMPHRAGAPGTPTVLHVVDRAGGGVPLAVASYIRSTSADARHVVLAPEASQAWAGLGATRISLPANPVRRARALRRAVRAVDPTAVHAHSSIAGCYARVLVRRRRVPIVYSPHCFAFTRTDLAAPVRWLLRAAEKVMSWNTSVLVACSPGEARLAARLNRSLHVVYAPNLAQVPVRARTRPRRAGGTMTIGTAGRICAQKDPHRFAAIVTELRRTSPGLRATWIGDGNPGMRRDLADAGVEVTGWLSRSALTDAFDELDVYVHSAAWEGFPLSLLDARNRAVPALVRPADWLPELDDHASTSESALGALRAALRDGAMAEWTARNLRYWRGRLSEHTAEHQRAALLSAWRADDREHAR